MLNDELSSEKNAHRKFRVKVGTRFSNGHCSMKPDVSGAGIVYARVPLVESNTRRHFKSCVSLYLDPSIIYVVILTSYIFDRYVCSGVL